MWRDNKKAHQTERSGSVKKGGGGGALHRLNAKVTEGLCRGPAVDSYSGCSHTRGRLGDLTLMPPTTAAQ